MSELAPNPNSFYYEMQQELLHSEQRRISQELFINGTTPRLISALRHTRSVERVRGLSEFDKLFVPSLRIVDMHGKCEQKLSLTAITIDPETGHRSNDNYELGLIDSTGTLFPYEVVPKEYANQVHAAALSLEQLKADGALPNLSSDLLSINNPNTDITALAPPE